MYPRDEKRERPLFGAILPLAVACALAVSSVAGAAGAKLTSPPVPSPSPELATPATPVPPVSRAEAQAFLQALAPFFATTHESLVVQRRPGGTLSVDMSGRFVQTAIATVQPDGRLSWSCVNNLAEAAAVLAGPPALEER